MCFTQCLYFFLRPLFLVQSYTKSGKEEREGERECVRVCRYHDAED